MVLLGTAIPTYSMPCRQPTPGRPNCEMRAGGLLGEFSLLITEILNSRCGQPTPDWLVEGWPSGRRRIEVQGLEIP
jgi:hypothetical protein